MCKFVQNHDKIGNNYYIIFTLTVILKSAGKNFKCIYIHNDMKISMLTKFGIYNMPGTLATSVVR